MRMMLRVKIPVTEGNRVVQDGSIQKVLEGLMDELKPESAYFYAEDGVRAASLVFDMTDSSQIPSIGEPLFINLNAETELFPVMNIEDLGKGLEAFAKTR